MPPDIPNPLAKPQLSLFGDAVQTYVDLDYEILQGKYYDFTFPLAKITMGGKVLTSEDEDMVVNDIVVELSSGFEASVATFRIYNVYNGDTGQFRFEKVKDQVILGNPLAIQLGYLGALESVFVGFVAGITFGYEPESLPYIEIAGMDIKGLMMGGSYASQCTARNYSGAVSEILKRTGYEKLKSAGGILDMVVEDTPDVQKGTEGSQQKESAYTVELVSESDYEFVVKAAKKFNYEFFVDRGKVVFRKARSDTSTLVTLGSAKGLISFRVEYSLTGIVGEIEARAMDPGEGKLITAKDSFPPSGQEISSGGQAKNLLGGGKKVYIDPSIRSQAEADARVASLKNKMSYRLGTLEGECIGIPDLVPGRFMVLKGLGAPVDNDFYLEMVTHEFNGDKGFHTRIKARANKVVKDAPASLPGGD